MTYPVWISAWAVFALKLSIALATTGLLLVNLLLHRSGRAERFQRARDTALLVLGVAGGLGWWYFLGLPVLGHVHYHDFYHYFLGARYFPELGYTRLYICTLAADQEAGLGAGIEHRPVRNLETNVLEVGGSAVGDIATCRAHFTTERWHAFTSDVAWFRDHQTVDDWQTSQLDHGFNGSPVWLLAGALVANAGGGVESLSFWLRLLDPLLLLGMWAGVVAGFGWRAACVAAVFWGTNGFAGFNWTGGSFLRQDWLVALVLGISCLRCLRPGTSGALLTLSTLLRMFPGIPLAVLALKAGLEALRQRTLRPSPRHVRFVLGCLLMLTFVLPLATWRAGVGAWAGFAANSRKTLETPMGNQMGLRTVVAYDDKTTLTRLQNRESLDPWLDWRVAQKQNFSDRWWLFAGIGVLYLVLLIRALPANEDWVALALGTGAIPIATQLTCYYHAALIGLALLCVRKEAAGVALCALAAVTQLLDHAFPFSDVGYAWMSLAEIATILFVTWLFAKQPRGGKGWISSAVPNAHAHSGSGGPGR